MSFKVVCKVTVQYTRHFLLYGTFCKWTNIPILSDSSVESAVKIVGFFKTKDICMPKNYPRKLKLSTALFQLSKCVLICF